MLRSCTHNVKSSSNIHICNQQQYLPELESAQIAVTMAAVPQQATFTPQHTQGHV